MTDKATRNPLVDKLESTFLPDFLRRQRWFAGKARELRRVIVFDRAAIPDARPPLLLALVDVEYANSPSERYFVPLTAGDDPTDALSSAMTCRALLASVIDRAPITMSSGATVRFSPTPPWSDVACPVESARIRVLDQEQTNSSFIVDDRFFFKLFRRLEEGPNPEAEIGSYLASRPSYRRSPRLFGSLEYVPVESATATLGVLEESLEGCENAWSFTLDELGRFRERCRALPAPSGSEPALSVVRETAREYLQVAADLGGATAELHLALADDGGNPAFRPMEIAREDLVNWSGSMAARTTRNLGLLESSLSGLPPDAVPDARRALARAPEIAARFREFRNLRTGGVRRIRCHGDYHLGQVLRRRSGGSLFIIDFEGEPARPIEERRSRMPAFKDVAGMLRSFTYAARAGLVSRGAGQDRQGSWPRTWLAAWESAVTSEFLKNYWKGANKGSFLPDDEKAFERWIEVFLLEKAIYEIGYELNQRPDWIGIPLSGLVSILER